MADSMAVERLWERRPAVRVGGQREQGGDAPGGRGGKKGEWDW
eukprot:CAMPEP_0117677706 /NCGR_PEP_ID=MMETSP0804-20121206/16888_1 /TAXON_ID=1074897 /ORGANISM="Tetraselmis astigmatica, Strain CCMP880" /LENGTH=42 /DNA_ID= /DNA_START= /DNA_END= /DNA_ORIENTATION=